MRLRDLPIGALVMDANTRYYDEPIIWKIASKSHRGYPFSSVTLITERIICLKAVDAKEPYNDDDSIRYNGNNRYTHSNIHQWLNSDRDDWFMKQHNADEPPSKDNVSGGYNPYDTESGFLTNFSTHFKNVLLDTDLEVVNSTRYYPELERFRAKIFLASRAEIGLSSTNSVVEGSKLDLFDDDYSRITNPTSQAVKRSNITNSNLSANKRWDWWLRTPYFANPAYMCYFSSRDSNSPSNANFGMMGIRPLCNVRSDTFVSKNPNLNGLHVMFNITPTTPSSLDFRSPIRSDKEFTLTWGQSTDSDAVVGEQITYVLERKLDENNWIERYRGTNLTFNDTIAQGSKKVMYRVKAVDSKGGESEWKTSESVSVVDNLIPVITSASQADLGVKDSPFSVNYMITDEDEGQTYTVTEYIDDVQKRSYVANLNEEKTFTVTEAEWKEVINGAHRLKVKVVDSMNGQAEKVFNFSKNEDRIEVSLVSPLTADDIISVALINVDMEIPEGASFLVEACNNGFDTEPVWKNVTKQVKERKKIFFANETKTAENWGLNIRVKVQRNGAIGDCIIRGIGGNFE